jgi:hypothetical protein
MVRLLLVSVGIQKLEFGVAVEAYWHCSVFYRCFCSVGVMRTMEFGKQTKQTSDVGSHAFDLKVEVTLVSTARLADR